MKNYTLASSQLTAFFVSNANTYTFAEAELEVPVYNTFRLDVENEALDFDDTRLTLSGADSDPVTQVAPEFKPYFEEGCEVAFMSESSSSANRDAVISAMKSELSDYRYYTAENSSKYYLIGIGTSNVTKTQFYTPALSTNADVKQLTLWD